VFCSNLHWHDDLCTPSSPTKYVCEKAPDPCANGKNIIINIMIYNLRKSKFQKDQYRVEILMSPVEKNKTKIFLNTSSLGDISPGPEGKKAH
jgi:hypothetical protein